MDKQDRKPNGQFAPKGTGDQTGGKSGSAVNKLGFTHEGYMKHLKEKSKPFLKEIGKLQKEYDDLHYKYWHTELKADEAKAVKSKMDEVEGKMADLYRDSQNRAYSFSNKRKKGIEVEDWEIGEAVNDMEWAILPDETVEQVAEQASKKLKVPKERVLALLTKESKAKPSDKYWDTADDFSKGLNKGFKEVVKPSKDDDDLPF